MARIYFRYLSMGLWLGLCVACGSPTAVPPSTEPPRPTLALSPTLALLGQVITDAPAIAPPTVMATEPILPAATPPPTTLGAMVSGLVWSDRQADGQFQPDETRIAEIQINLSLGICPGHPLTTTTTNDDGVYRFDSLSAGTYCVHINPQPQLTQGNWSYPAPGIGQATVIVPINGNGVANFGWDYQSTLTPTTTAACTHQASYVTDVTIPDNTVIPAGEPFVKTWRIKNEGSCSWSTTYALAFDGGASMEAPMAMPLPQTVTPGSTVDISVSFVAPVEAGIYRSDWLLRTPDGETFGSHNSYPFYVQIVVNPVRSTSLETQAAMIGGVIWADSCQTNASYVVGCIADGAGGYRADGQLNNQEARLAGVQVRLNPGACPGRNDLFSTATTDAQGIYRFDKVAAGTYCVSVNPLWPSNEALLMPGNWTYPAVGLGYTTVTVGVGEQKTADFGWDYQNR